jgi:signal transduction histidine kinase
VSITVDGDEGLASPVVQDEVFLVVREALRNAMKHAGADMISARIDFAAHELRAVIDDDGAGFDPRGCAAGPGMGIKSMQERVALLGGAMVLTSAPGEGAHIEFAIPLPGGRNARA